MTITTAIERLGRIGNSVDVVIDKALKATEQDYIALNESQMAKGKLNDGSDIIPTPYSPGYAKRRQKAGLQTGFIDLRFTGAFYKGFTVQRDLMKLNLGSNVAYEKYISGRYTEKIYGLTPENMVKYREIIQPLILGELKAAFYG